MTGTGWTMAEIFLHIVGTLPDFEMVEKKSILNQVVFNWIDAFVFKRFLSGKSWLINLIYIWLQGRWIWKRHVVLGEIEMISNCHYDIAQQNISINSFDFILT